MVSYIKYVVDAKKRPGYFILTGSENFLANQAITESLAGRVGLLTLLPLSLEELIHNKLITKETSLNEVILKGGYPQLYDEAFLPNEYYPSYTQTYLERDIRRLINVDNLSLFQHFVQLCAGRIGQLLNIGTLCNDLGISFSTARKWLSLLESSYILFLLQPHTKSFDKRLVKTPKLYFFDTGLACSLLRITSVESLAFSPFRGALFESLIIADLYKQYCNKGQRPSLYFWRDRGGAHEVDCILDEGHTYIPIEIKAAQTISPHFFKGVTYWNKIAKADPSWSYIVYGGDAIQQRKLGNIIGWQTSHNLINTVHTKIEQTLKTPDSSKKV